MRHYLIITLFVLALLAGPAFGAQVSIGVQIGPPPPPRIEHVRPAQPGIDYAWVDGYWYPVGHHWKWHKGYWTRAPYAGARWLAPRYEGGQYYEGYWEGGRGRMEHRHDWDKHRERDYWEHEHSQGHDRDHDRDHH
jgi:WXXGXW repeat (2 copies)